MMTASNLRMGKWRRQYRYSITVGKWIESIIMIYCPPTRADIISIDFSAIRIPVIGGSWSIYIHHEIVLISTTAKQANVDARADETRPNVICEMRTRMKHEAIRSSDYRIYASSIVIA